MNEPQREKTLDALLIMYIESMNAYERVAYEIAKDALESSYDMEKSIGFVEFVKKNDYVILG